MDEEEDKGYRVFSWTDLGPILTAAVFSIMFLACLVWVLITDDPWHDFVPRAKPQQPDTPGIVNVTLPQKH
ncbi:MAG TPA: hypothetical protein VMU01_06680 [Rhizomicrobium sp.]|nr:hypothetical protein [Rhizomicrobium sp.]